MEYISELSDTTMNAGKMYFQLNFFRLLIEFFFSLCCQCGVLIDPNALNMCNGCMQTQIDITEQIPKQGQLQMCNKCIR